LVEGVDQLLGAAHGKRGDDDLAAALVGFDNRLAQHLARLVAGLVPAIAIGAFHDQEIGAVHRLWVAQDGHAVAAQVAGEDQPALLLPLDDIQHDDSRSQNVAGVQKSGGDARCRRKGPVIVDADELLDGLDRIMLGVQRADRRQAVALPLAVDVESHPALGCGRCPAAWPRTDRASPACSR
jgi:hypothetical protein